MIWGRQREVDAAAGRPPAGHIGARTDDGSGFPYGAVLVNEPELDTRIGQHVSNPLAETLVGRNRGEGKCDSACSGSRSHYHAGKERVAEVSPRLCGHRITLRLALPASPQVRPAGIPLDLNNEPLTSAVGLDIAPAGTRSRLPWRSGPPTLGIGPSVGDRPDTVSRVIHRRSVSEVSIRELRNHGGDVIDRVVAGERVTVTRDGRPVAELRPLGRAPVPSQVLWRRWSRLPPLDVASFRCDIDRVLDSSL